jgi:hypothetical protein
LNTWPLKYIGSQLIQVSEESKPVDAFLSTMKWFAKLAVPDIKISFPKNVYCTS